MMSRFTRAFIVIAVALFVLFSIAIFHPPESAKVYMDPITGAVFGDGGVERKPDNLAAGADVRQSVAGVAAKTKVEEERVEGSIMPALRNETARAELGRATWRLMHTMTLRFPETPTADERKSLNDYFYLMGQLYPCGDCARHFRGLLEKFPPQTSGRKAASNWLCYVHNQVNERLEKPDFDCSYLGDTYDCGCGPDPGEKKADGEAAKKPAEGEDGEEANELDAPVQGGRR